jgi:hypothetical protein
MDTSATANQLALITGRSVSGKVFPEKGKFFPAANEAATAGTEESEREALVGPTDGTISTV